MGCAGIVRVSVLIKKKKIRCGYYYYFLLSCEKLVQTWKPVLADVVLRLCYLRQSVRLRRRRKDGTPAETASQVWRASSSGCYTRDVVTLCFIVTGNSCQSVSLRTTYWCRLPWCPKLCACTTERASGCCSVVAFSEARFSFSFHSCLFGSTAGTVRRSV